MSSNETRWEEFVDEISRDGIIWTLEKSGEYVTSDNRYGTKCFPWWSSRERVLKQISQVPAYKGYQQIGFEWSTFLNEWVPSLRQAKCLLGINYAKPENIGFDLPISEVVNAIQQAKI
ncbi:DUF2750 domain-containing protein [Aestuariirhabdus sp. Z084]|uniref:DUF2750 domain-containing protein n=1 Tax=Aestuariirhabdus haliotis TaxID=2918751 RepID=UPI00201B3B6A|nr:DUF2750 domain-containing protein [Aestuariirhabdus haliotis]MCL6417865.1 DUF2750 domain-containing protein [Aestuariirhabdus haliotis]MCL6421753.1 DUF2750 domain-containing protein [Aestuariirhabdus haliotis]